MNTIICRILSFAIVLLLSFCSFASGVMEDYDRNYESEMNNKYAYGPKETCLPFGGSSSFKYFKKPNGWQFGGGDFMYCHYIHNVIQQEKSAILQRNRWTCRFEDGLGYRLCERSKKLIEAEAGEKKIHLALLRIEQEKQLNALEQERFEQEQQDNLLAEKAMLKRQMQNEKLEHEKMMAEKREAKRIKEHETVLENCKSNLVKVIDIDTLKLADIRAILVLAKKELNSSRSRPAEYYLNQAESSYKSLNSTIEMQSGLCFSLDEYQQYMTDYPRQQAQLNSEISELRQQLIRLNGNQENIKPPIKDKTLVVSWKDACKLLEKESISTRARRKDSLGYSCASKYIDIGNAFPLPNNIAYYVLGSNTHVEKLYLVLNVYDMQDSHSAHQKFLEASSSLYLSVLQKKLPSSFIDPLSRNWSDYSKEIDGYWVRTKHETWSTGKGYEVHFIISPL